MSEPVNIHDSKMHLSRLVERVEAGEEIVLARAGRPVARLVPYRGRREPRVPGGWKGRADPLDRMLVAQAETLGATIVSRDVALDAYGINPADGLRRLSYESMGSSARQM